MIKYKKLSHHHFFSLRLGRYLLVFFSFCFLNLLAEPKMLFQVKSPNGETNQSLQSSQSTKVTLLAPQSELIAKSKSPFYKRLLEKVSYFNTKVYLLARQYLANPSPSLLVLVLSIAFLYGVLHAAGPGHGKTVLSSFMLSREIKLGKGILLSFGVALIHILVALLVVAVLYLFLQGYRVSQFQDISRVLTFVSASFILMIGIYFLIQSLRELKAHHSHAHSHGHEPHEHHHDHSHEVKARKDLSNKSIAGMMFSIGLVPCPGPISILLFSIYAKALYLGLLCALAMALGMGATYALAVLAVKTVKKITFRSGSQKWAERLHHFYEIFGAILILLVGSLILISAFSQSIT